MILNFAILLLVGLSGGVLAYYTSELPTRVYRLALVFSGAYLFGITIVHILPELFIQAHHPERIGMYVLIGFFLQQWLEKYTQGVEHGHLHEHSDQHGHLSGVTLLIALSVHAFLEGSLLSHQSTIHAVHDTGPLLWGIALHKFPAAFALMSVIRCQDKRLGRSILYLLIFVMASPLGMFLGELSFKHQLLTTSAFSIVFAIVSGNFLHISTTIVFESNESHRLNYQKWMVAVLGAGLAVLVEII